MHIRPIRAFLYGPGNATAEPESRKLIDLHYSLPIPANVPGNRFRVSPLEIRFPVRQQ